MRDFIKLTRIHISEIGGTVGGPIFVRASTIVSIEQDHLATPVGKEFPVSYIYTTISDTSRFVAESPEQIVELVSAAEARK